MTEADQAPPGPVMAKLIEWLQEAGYRAKASEQGNAILSATSGLNFWLYPFETSIQFFMGLTLDDSAQMTLEDCNTHNREWRFTRVYLDEDQDLVAEMDVIVDHEKPYAQEVFLQGLSIWDNALGQIRSWVMQRPQGDGEDEAPLD